MLDSGAFSVWSQGKTIDLEAYIAFCKLNPEVSYYVNLDVIPGKPGQKEGRFLAGGLLDHDDNLSEEIEKSCQQGWNNYQQMLEHLPFEKVIPVFHQDDGFKWLKKYVDFGTPYIGISPANDRTTSLKQDSKARWMDELVPLLFHRDGRPKIKTHGFAVTSFALMKFWQWHSVDSASWKLQGAWGSIYIPKGLVSTDKRVKYLFGDSPISLGISPLSPTKSKPDAHFTNLSPSVKERVVEFIAFMGYDYGKWRITNADKDHQPTRGWEYWIDKEAGELMVVEEQGVATHHALRCLFNGEYMLRTQPYLPVDHIYLAGAPMAYWVEPYLTNRLLSFVDVKPSSRGNSPPAWKQHLGFMRDQDANRPRKSQP